MSSSTYDPPVDPAVAACAQITTGLDALAGLPAELVGGAAVRQVIDTMMVGRSRTAGLLARYLGQAESRSLYPPVGGGHPTAAWLRHRYRLRPRAATRLVDRALEVVSILPAVGAAMVDGRADVEQADALVTGMDRLPATGAQRHAVLDSLLDRCDSEDPIELARSATRAAQKLTLVSADGEAPDDEADQHAKRYLRLRRRDGGTEGRFWADGELGAQIAALINARCAPDDAGHGDPADPEGRDTRSPDQRRFDALADALGHASTCEHTPGPPLPTVIITLNFDALTARLGAATLTDTGQPLPASVARRLCCEAALIPSVLDGDSLPLDLGRDQRLFSRAQRHALALRDQGCSFAGCDEPPGRCQAHHLTESADGGPTDLTNAALLCPRHHRQLHCHGWTGRIAANGRPEYLPPPWIDPQQKPRQHIRYQLDQILRT